VILFPPLETSSWYCNPTPVLTQPYWFICFIKKYVRSYATPFRSSRKVLLVKLQLSLLEKLTVTQTRNSLPSVKLTTHECSVKPAAGHAHSQISSVYVTLLLQDPFQYYPSMHACISEVVVSLQVYRIECYIFQRPMRATCPSCITLQSPVSCPVSAIHTTLCLTLWPQTEAAECLWTACKIFENCVYIRGFIKRNASALCFVPIRKSITDKEHNGNEIFVVTS
jgi:hypothetical protein